MYWLNLLTKSVISSDLNKYPPSPLLNISFGPLGQSEEIIGFLRKAASIKTNPGSSHLDVKTKHLALFK